MFALTISQPYASLIDTGKKWVENRSWETKYRGPLAIHAGKGTQYLTSSQLAAYPTGVVLAVADLVGCVHIDRLRLMADVRPKERITATNWYWSEILRHQYTEGPWCWLLSNVRRLEFPFPCRGAQGLWRLPQSEDLERLLCKGEYKRT